MWPEIGAWAVAYADGTIGMRRLSANPSVSSIMIKSPRAKHMTPRMAFESHFQVFENCSFKHEMLLKQERCSM